MSLIPLARPLLSVVAMRYTMCITITEEAAQLAATRLIGARLPEKLLAQIDGLVGPGKRSEFIIRAVERAVLQASQEKALKAAEGSWAAADYPEFATADDTEKWVRQVREGSEERVRRARGK